METMKAIYKVAALVALLAAFSSCNKKEGSESGKSISLWANEEVLSNAATRADATVDRKLQPLFVFWTEGNFNDATKSAPDFFVRTPDGDINTYTTPADPYNTGAYYPLYNKEVYATGVAPAPGEGYLEFVTANDYSKFKIARPASQYPDDTYGVTDVLAATKITGTDAAPFVPNHPLIFKHQTTKISFRAKLDETMTKFVKYVTVKFPGTLAPVSLEWNATNEAYELKAGASPAQDFVFGNFWTEDGQFVSRDPRANWTQFYQLTFDYQNMGFTHIMPPGSSMDVTIQFKMANRMSDFDTQTGISDIEVPVTINFVDSSDAAVELKAGDAYLVSMNINVFDIELIGRKVAWQDGGYISVPIQIR